MLLEAEGVFVLLIGSVVAKCLKAPVGVQIDQQELTNFCFTSLIDRARIWLPLIPQQPQALSLVSFQYQTLLAHLNHGIVVVRGRRLGDH